jgi:formate hydrogenlyase subunit 5
MRPMCGEGSAACVRRSVAPAELVDRCQAVLAAGGRMQMAYGYRPGGGKAVEMIYLAAPATGRLELWRCPVPADRALPSLTPVAPLLGWYEREAGEDYELTFTGHPEPAPLRGGPHLGRPTEWPDTAARPEFRGGEVQVLPFGPVRGGVLESARFLFFYAGEAILHYEPNLFLKHRGVERRFEGLTAEIAVAIAERVSGVGSVAHALAYCQAVEDAALCQPPARALGLRTLLAEMERVYNHLHYFGALCHATTLKVGEADGLLLEEEVKQIAAALTGSRFLRGLLTPGGLRRDLDPKPAVQALAALRPRIDRYLRRLNHTRSHLDRLMDTGALDHRTALEQGATGPVARASGLAVDLRCDFPYAAYDAWPPALAIGQRGDAQARAEVRAAEMESSLDLLERIPPSLRFGPVRAAVCIPPDAEGLGWSESPRGALFYALHFDHAGRLARLKIKSPSFSNWRAFPFTVHGTSLMDYAINEASFGLTIAGCAR